MNYFGSKISDNMIKTKDGFLICQNVPISRTGKQEYLDTELYEIGGVGKIIKVNREEEEVFSDEAIASFEGKPFTNEHPSELVNPENFNKYVKGHIQNVRRGKGKFKDNLVADIFVNDIGTIEDIQNGKREISCGYECEDIEGEDGELYQTNIRGNHIALVSRGRAGSKVAIRDKQINKREEQSTMENQVKENMTNNDANIISKLLDHIFKDEDKKEKKEEKKEEFITKEEFDKKMDELKELFKGKKEEEVEKTEDKKDACGKKDEEEKKDKKDGEVIEAKDNEPTIKDVLDTLNPLIAKVSDEELRKSFVDGIAKFVDRGENPIGKVEQTIKDSAMQTSFDSYEEIQKAYDERNPHIN